VARGGLRDGEGKQGRTSAFRQHPQTAVRPLSASYLGPDGQCRNAPETFGRKSDADRVLSLIESQMARGEWTDPERGKVKLADYAETWITERPGLRPRSADNYRWLLTKHIEPHIGGVPVGKLSAPLIRQWRATLIGNGVSVSTAAKAYRFLRAVLMTAAEEDKILPRNPCRIKGAGDEKAEERPVLTVAQVSSWPSGRAVGRSATSASSWAAVTGSGSPGTARCERRRRSSAPGPRPSARCGRWPTRDGPTATMTAGSPPSSCWLPSPASAGAKSSRCGALWSG